MRLFSHPRFLPVYSGVLTAALLVGVLAGFVRVPDNASFKSIDVQRIRLVEPDGTVRMIIADNANMPGVIFKGREYPFEERKAGGTAGMLFFDAEGTESGGLTFGGLRGKDGKVERFGHLSFDQYGQDELMSLNVAQQGGEKRSGLLFKDEPDWPLEDMVKLVAAHKDDPPEVRHKIVADYLKAHGAMHVQRAWLGRDEDRSAALELKDTQGRSRLVARVAADGTPSLVFLDANGKVTERWPQVAAK